jgi:hypothetical protein
LALSDRSSTCVNCPCSEGSDTTTPTNPADISPPPRPDSARARSAARGIQIREVHGPDGMEPPCKKAERGEGPSRRRRSGAARRYLSNWSRQSLPWCARVSLRSTEKGEQWRPGLQISWGPGRRGKVVETRRGGKGRGGPGFLLFVFSVSCRRIRFPPGSRHWKR